MTDFTASSEYVTDTMALVLWLEKRRLSSLVRTIFAGTETGEVTLYIPAIVFAEILYLSEKRKISIAFETMSHYLNTHKHYKECPLSLSIIQESSTITDIKELHDRLIAGTAKFMNLPLITNDPVIEASGSVKTVW